MFKFSILFFVYYNHIYMYIYIIKCLDYAVFNESWENELEINYHNNTDNRIVFLMELYAWSKVFEVKSRELLDLQKDIGNITEIIKLCIVHYCIIIAYYKFTIFNIKITGQVVLLYNVRLQIIIYTQLY